MSRHTDQDKDLPIKIISGDVSHGPLLAAIHQDAFEAPWSEKSFSKLLTLPTVSAWLGVITDPVGFILTQQAADEVEILTVAVCEHAQCKGFGRSLIEFALEEARLNGAAKSHLEVAEDNTAARHLYHAVGFSDSGRRRGYYTLADKSVDAITMAKTLA